jgi:hypothetical protein
VLTVPHALRARLAFDGELLGEVSRVFAEVVLGHYRRWMTDRGYARGKSGAITVVQRVSSDLRLNPHLHSVVLDGVYVSNGAKTEFHQLPNLSSDQVADVLQAVETKVLRLLTKKRVIADCESGEVVDGDPDDVMQQVAQSAVSGRPPAGPEARQRVPVELPDHGAVRVAGALLATGSGFSLHAATVVRKDDVVGREALVRYVLRPPLAQERVKVLSDGLVRLTLKRVFSDGTWAVDLDPLSLLYRLTATIPPPKVHTVRYYGVLAPASKLRSAVVPGRPKGLAEGAHAEENSADEQPTAKRWRPWCELLKRTFGIDVEQCPSCGGRMKLRALVIEAENVARYLRKLGETTELPPRAPARDPPYFKTEVVRRKLRLAA